MSKLSGKLSRNPVYLLILGFWLIVLIPAAAQSPSLFSYQLIARDPAGAPYVNQGITVRMIIWDGSANVYSEDHYVTTDEKGLINLNIGNGLNKVGDIGSIDWGDGPYSWRIQIDPLGGTSFTTLGTYPMTSVPYSLYAGSAGNTDGSETKLNAGTLLSISGTGTIPDPYLISSTADGSETKLSAGSNITVSGAGTAGSPYIVGSTIIESDPLFAASAAFGISEPDTANWNDKQDAITAGTGISITGNTISAEIVSLKNDFYLGQDTLGGIVYHVDRDNSGNQRGYIVSKTKASLQWQDPTSVVGANRKYDGKYNFNLMVDSPAKDWIVANFSPEWYLPAIDELGLLWVNRWVVNKKLRADGAPASDLIVFSELTWASTEHSTPATQSYILLFGSGAISGYNKGSNGIVRPIRTFETLGDIDGNTYLTVTIGTQVWMSSNLRTTKYSDGTDIDYPGADNSVWQLNSTGAYAWYDNDESTNRAPHGALYNWHAVNNSAGLCPAGWKVPDDSDWTTLITYLGGDSDAGGEMKETGFDYWDSPNTGATNESGFSARGSGLRGAGGGYSFMGIYGGYWSSTDPGGASANLKIIANNGANIQTSNNSKEDGLSIRCIKE